VPLDATLVKAAARRAGFRAGIARAAVLDPAPLERVVANGWQADMAWLGAQHDQR
jgi:hypothetical protein